MKIARCNNCWSLIHDDNPSEESFDFTEKQLEGFIIENPDFSKGYMCCPACETDDYLCDLTSIEELNQSKALQNEEE